MKIIDVAKQIFFSPTIEEKFKGLLDASLLHNIENEIGEGYVSSLKASEVSLLSDYPSREAKIDFSQSGKSSKNSFPIQVSKIWEINSNKATLLHFFANHELLASELMSLCLLRFPQAPIDFRRELFSNLLDEVRHFSLYKNKMEELGLGFGELKVNGFFWSHLHKMKSPLDFITKMSLTFEQANLDYMLAYIKIFKKLEDHSFCNIFKEVLSDEIKHVHTGVEYFELLHPQKKPLNWKTYTEELGDSLKPIRARGKIFHSKVRLASGLSIEYINELKNYRYSKGRPPRVFYFYPYCEEELMDKNFNTDKGNIRELESDLDALLFFLASPEDLVIQNSEPSESFIKHLERLNINKIETLKKEKIEQGLKNRKISEIRPWGFSPSILVLFHDYIHNVCGPSYSYIKNLYQKKDEFGIFDIYKKNFGVTCLEKCIKDNVIKSSNDLELNEVGEVGTICLSMQEVNQAIQYYYERYGYIDVCAKAPLGLAGRGVLKINTSKNDTSIEIRNNFQYQWIEGTLKNQGSIVIEPYHERLVDISVQFEILPNSKTKNYGITRILCTSQGRYVGNMVGGFLNLKYSKHPFVLCGKQENFFEERNFEIQKKYKYIMETLRLASVFVSQKLISENYIGPVGIDAFVYWDSIKNKIVLRPIVEINPRYTMGRLALQFSKYVKKGRTFVYRIFTAKNVKDNHCKNFLEYSQKLSKEYPLCFSRNDSEDRGDFNSPLIERGYYYLTDPEKAKKFMAAIIVL